MCSYRSASKDARNYSVSEKQENQIQTDNNTNDDNNVATNNIDREILCFESNLIKDEPSSENRIKCKTFKVTFLNNSEVDKHMVDIHSSKNLTPEKHAVKHLS